MKGRDRTKSLTIEQTTIEIEQSEYISVLQNRKEEEKTVEDQDCTSSMAPQLNRCPEQFIMSSVRLMTRT